VHRNYWCVITVLAFIFYPKPVHANGMSGFAFLILPFILLGGAVPGAIVKLIVPLPAKSKGLFATKVLILTIMEAIFMAIAAELGIMLVVDAKSLSEAPYFLFPATPIYLVLATFPNLLLFRAKNQRLTEAVLKAGNILKAASIAFITPVCFGILIGGAAY